MQASREEGRGTIVLRRGSERTGPSVSGPEFLFLLNIPLKDLFEVKRFMEILVPSSFFSKT